MIIEELPVILVLHLNSIKFNLNGCTEIIKALEFPIDLNIKCQIQRTPREKHFQLFAVLSAMDPMLSTLSISDTVGGWGTLTLLSSLFKNIKCYNLKDPEYYTCCFTAVVNVLEIYLFICFQYDQIYNKMKRRSYYTSFNIFIY